VVKPSQTAHGYTPIDVLQSPVFYVMYLMFVLIAAGGLTMAASMAPIAEDFKISKIPVELFGMILPALGFALFLNRIFDGVGRPFFGWLSDQIGREYTMALAFLIGAGALFTLSRSGSKYAAANNGMLYTAKGAGSLLVPIAAILAKSYGWGTVFTVAMTFNVVAALLALFVLKPMRTRHFAKSRATFEP
jgi:MFS transporter, OFA family, oxalate/formate antiporter